MSNRLLVPRSDRKLLLPKRSLLHAPALIIPGVMPIPYKVASGGVVPGSSTFDGTDVGDTTGNFIVPAHNTLTIEVWGAGVTPCGTNSRGIVVGFLVTSRNSSVSGSGLTTMTANGGNSGNGSNASTAGQVAGTASGGNNQNLSGSLGSIGSGTSASGGVPTVGGAGANAPAGGFTGGAGGVVAAAASSTWTDGSPGSGPGAGGGGPAWRGTAGAGTYSRPPGGPSAGYCKTIVSAGVISVGTSLAYVAAQIMQPAATSQAFPGKGGPGRVKFTWV